MKGQIILTFDIEDEQEVKDFKDELEQFCYEGIYEVVVETKIIQES